MKYITKILINSVIIFSQKFNQPFLFALIFYLKLKKKISIKKNKDKKKLIILAKSGGNEDIIYSVKNGVSKKNIYLSNRDDLRTIHNLFTKNSSVNEYYKYNVSREINNKNYVEFLKNFLKYLEFLIGSFEFVTFNFNYRGVFPLAYTCDIKKISFYICFKECLSTKFELKIITGIYKNYYKSFDIFKKISTYNNLVKNQLIKSKLIDKKKIDVIGYPRLPYKNLGENHNLNITFFLIEPEIFFGAFKHNHIFKTIQNFTSEKINKKCDWSPLLYECLNSIIMISKAYPKISFNLKGKAGVHSKIIEKLKKKNLPNNIKIFDGGIGNKLIENSDLIISFKSTVIYESMFLRKNIIVPYFKKYRTKPYNLFINEYPSIITALSKNDFERKILNFIKQKSKYNSYNLIFAKKYLGNPLNSKNRLKNFLKI